MSDTTETIGAFTFSVACREPAPEARQRFDQRAETLAAWLVAQWLRSQKEVSNDDRAA